MAEVLDAPAAPAAAPAAPAAPAPAQESLIHGEPAPASPAAPAAAPAPADTFTFADKVLTKTADGAGTDWEATARKAEQARQHLEKRLGTGDTRPANPAEYTFKVPDEMQGLELAPERFEAFKAQAHEKGITAAQFEWMMGSYFAAVPDLMQSAAKLTADQARAELGKVWASPDQMVANLSAAQRAAAALPQDLREATLELGTNPAFLRAMAHFGAQMGEDRAPAGGSQPSGGMDVKALEASPAYRDPKHPDHARVSQQVAAFYSKTFGDQPI